MSRRMTRSSRESTRHDIVEEPASRGDEDAAEKAASDDESPIESYYFEGVSYPSYQEMVNAKRKRNQQVLIDSGLMDAVDNFKQTSRRVTLSSQKRRKTAPPVPLPRRSSNRIKGIQSDGFYVEDERAGRFVVAGSAKGDSSSPNDAAADSVTYIKPKESFYANRINDGADVSVKQAVDYAGGDAEEAALAERFLASLSGEKSARRVAMPTDTGLGHHSNLQNIHVEAVAKLTRDRIYSVAAHPSLDSLIVAAGDKQGNIGLWNVDAAAQDSDDGACYEFKYHTGAVNFLQFANDKSLMSCSYDGTVRLFDIEKQSMSQVFAAFDDSDEFQGRLGYDLDTGYKYWTQNLCLDHRVDNGLAFFVSTSTGMVFHVDLRASEMTFNKQLSEKKINTVSLHQNGLSLLTAGLDGLVSLWDVRNFGGKKKPNSICSFQSGKSVNSAYFSPSGKYVVSTNMADKLDIFADLHLCSAKSAKPIKRITHDNRTGRWLSTFMATWHPSLDIFTVGSMRKPREIQVFDPTGNIRNVVGEDLTAVASRCCFHPRVDRLAIIGGNSSGRVTVIR